MGATTNWATKPNVAGQIYRAFPLPWRNVTHFVMKWVSFYLRVDNKIKPWASQVSSNLAVAEKRLEFLSAPNWNYNNRAPPDVICRLHCSMKNRAKEIKNVLGIGVKKNWCHPTQTLSTTPLCCNDRRKQNQHKAQEKPVFKINFSPRWYLLSRQSFGVWNRDKDDTL